MTNEQGAQYVSANAQYDIAIKHFFMCERVRETLVDTK